MDSNQEKGASIIQQKVHLNPLASYQKFIHHLDKGSTNSCVIHMQQIKENALQNDLKYKLHRFLWYMDII